ncbi:MAG: Csu type fimbrial protein [Gammaproteobacteria bacterium]
MCRHFHFWLLATLSITLALAPIAASANTGRGQFVVSVNVIRECHIGMQNLASDTPAASPSSAAVRGAVTLSCSRNTAYAVSFGSRVSFASTTDSKSIAGVGNGTAQVIPVYSQMPLRRSKASGTPAGSLVMTINY